MGTKKDFFKWLIKDDRSIFFIIFNIFCLIGLITTSCSVKSFEKYDELELGAEIFLWFCIVFLSSISFILIRWWCLVTVALGSVSFILMGTFGFSNFFFLLILFVYWQYKWLKYNHKEPA